MLIISMEAPILVTDLATHPAATHKQWLKDMTKKMLFIADEHNASIQVTMACKISASKSSQTRSVPFSWGN